MGLSLLSCGVGPWAAETTNAPAGAEALRRILSGSTCRTVRGLRRTVKVHRCADADNDTAHRDRCAERRIARQRGIRLLCGDRLSGPGSGASDENWGPIGTVGTQGGHLTEDHRGNGWT